MIQSTTRNSSPKKEKKKEKRNEYALKAGPDLLCFGSVGVFGVLLSAEKKKESSDQNMIWP